MVPPMIVSSHSFSGKNVQKPHQKAMCLRPTFAFRGRKRKRHLRKVASRSYVKIKHCEIKQNSEIRERVHFELLLNVKGCLSMTRIKMDYNRGGSRIFFRRGCTRLLLYFNTNKPHSFFFCRIPVVLENRRSSQGRRGGAHPLHPPPRSSPV